MHAPGVREAMARSAVYGFLASAFEYPSEGVLEWLSEAGHALALLGDVATQSAFDSLVPTIEGTSTQDRQRAYVQCFGHTISKDCPPYESEYGQAHIFQKSQNLADIGGFYRAFGLELEPSFKERLDHISVEAEFMQFLCAKEAFGGQQGHPADKLQICRDAQARFLADHLGQWGRGFAAGLQQQDAAGIYGRLGRLLETFLASELDSFGVAPGEVSQPDVREPPALEDLDCGSCPVPAISISEASTRVQ